MEVCSQKKLKEQAAEKGLCLVVPPSPQTRLHTRCFYQLSPCVLVFEVGGYVTLSSSFKFPFAGYGSGINCQLVQGPTKPAELMSIWPSQTASNWACSMKIDMKIINRLQGVI